MRRFLIPVLLALGFGAQAQDLVVYDDALRNDFVPGYSYSGTVDFATTAPTRNGSPASIGFTSSGQGAIAFPNELRGFDTAQYSGLRFYVHGGATGGQQLRLHVYTGLGGAAAANVELDTFIEGNAVGANQWRLVEARFNEAPLAFSGAFKRLDVQIEGDGAQPVLYLDDVTLIAASSRIFADNFEGDGVAPTPPSFSIDDVTLPEGNAGSTVFTFTVTRSGGLSGNDTVQVQSADQTAQAGLDYAALAATTLAFAPDVASRTVTVNGSGDLAFEPDESFVVNLSNASSGSITDPQGVGTIQNDDAAPAVGELRFVGVSYSVAEDGGDASIAVERVNGSAGAISVEVTTSDASATAPDDYATTTALLNWDDGEIGVKSAFIPIVADAVPENNEAVGLMLANPGNGASLGMPQSAILTIVEPELLFVPQFNFGGAGSIKVYRRGVGGFAQINTAALSSGTNPNAVAFAPDGNLWVLDGTHPNRLLRFSPQMVATGVAPAPERVIELPTQAGVDSFDLAFFGDFLYVSQGNPFAGGNVHRVLKFALTSLTLNGAPVPDATFTPANLSAPAGLAFDPQGRLWIGNYSGQTLVRMNTGTGAVDRTINSAALAGGRASMSNPEGLAFDTEGTLWIGNNGAPTMPGYSAAQLTDAGFTAGAPAQFIDIAPGTTMPGAGHTGFVGGLAFDRDGDLWANYENDFSVIEYDITPNVAAGQSLANATADPGFGGLAFWPVPATLQRGVPGGAAAAQFRGTTLVSMEMPFTQFDAVNGPVPGTEYPVFDERLIDYFAAKGTTALRFLVGWEALQSQLMGPIPAAPNGNYKTYFEHYQRIVDYATNVKGMTVLITPWQYDDNVNGQGFGGIGGPTWRGGRVGTEVSIAAWSDFWTKLSTLFKDNPRVAYVLVTEPNNMSTTQWFQIAQAGITAIRNSGSTQRIHVPGNGYSAASTWVIGNAFYDTDAVKVSNANGWLNANGVGQPIVDPLNNIAVEVHSYVDADQGGVSDEITSVTALRNQLANTVGWALANGLRVYLGETGMHATTPVNGGGTAQQAWDDFIAYADANSDVLEGFTWWAGGDPAWWADEGANGGGHYAISPICGAAITPACPVPFSGDRPNMDMIENDF